MAKTAHIDEICFGGAAIAECLGLDKRAVYNLCAKGRLPTWKEGKILLARRASLRTWAVDREAAARAAGRFAVPARKRSRAA